MSIRSLAVAPLVVCALAFRSTATTSPRVSGPPCAGGQTVLSACALSDTVVVSHTGRSAFRLRNSGMTGRSYVLQCRATTPIVACEVNPRSLDAAAQSEHTIDVTYAASTSPGTGRVELDVSAGGADHIVSAIDVTVAEGKQ
jgi:hypothetical protein